MCAIMLILRIFRESTEDVRVAIGHIRLSVGAKISRSRFSLVARDELENSGSENASDHGASGLGGDCRREEKALSQFAAEAAEPNVLTLRLDPLGQH